MNSLPGGAYFGNYSFTNYASLGQYPTGDITNSLSEAASVSWNVKSHTLRAGVDLRDIQYITQNYSTALSLSADPGWTQANYAQADSVSGNSIASAGRGVLVPSRPHHRHLAGLLDHREPGE